MTPDKPLSIGIVGAGHNGLVCATYLAAAGHQVTVFEARKKTGGLCVTEEVFEGFRVSTVASYYGMLREEIAGDLKLADLGLQTYLSDPIEIVLLANGQYAYTPRAGGGSRYRIDGLTDADRSGWGRFWTDIQKAAAEIYPFYLRPAASCDRLQEVLRQAQLHNIADRLFDGCLLDLISGYLSNPALKAVASTCTPGFANQPGTIFGCMHHGTAKTNGQLGAWGFVKGGMGGITEAMTRAAAAAGVRFMLDCPIRQICIEDGTAGALETEKGRVIEFDCVISNADPWQTFGKLLQDAPSGKEQFLMNERLEREKPTVSAGKVHLALSRIPAFKVLDELQHNYQGVIVAAPSLDGILADSHAVPAGSMPRELMMTMSFPSAMDDTIAPPGKHLLTIDIHYLPAHANIQEAAILDKVLTDLEVHAFDIRDCVEDAYVVGPQRLQSDYRLSGASCWHLPMAPKYLADKRNFCGTQGHGTAWQRLYLCGAGTFPAGNVTGAPGYNCAQQILADYAAGRLTSKRNKEISHAVS